MMAFKVLVTRDIKKIPKKKSCKGLQLFNTEMIFLNFIDGVIDFILTGIWINLFFSS